ncbi:unnamed protein product [Oikopleura dioica]|uniref:Uncharacterized protein n=1 Tax=Oikopleura dioica TaxID=34765 RepID=E4WQJ1_OIKDI|nr:unnamed protein product [Oikopleura dioica]
MGWLLILNGLCLVRSAYKPPEQCFFCVSDQEEDCVRGQAAMKWDKMGCSDEHFDTECRTMEGIQVTLGAEPDNNEKIIEICGKRLGQCQPHFTSTNHIDMRMCCLDCDFTNSTMKLQKEINPKNDRRQMRVKVVLGIFAVFLLLAFTGYAAHMNFFIKRREVRPVTEADYFK